jgi:exodeoxyribonuclease VII small subunit
MNIDDKKEISFEEALTRLEQIVRLLENPTSPLDESLGLFEEGVSLVKICNHKLTNAEQKIKILINGQETDFVQSEDS